MQLHRQPRPALRAIAMIRSIRRLLLIAAFGAAASAAQASPQAALGAAERTRALEQVEARIRSTYVYPERRGAILDRLAAAAAEGRYETTDPIIFAQRVSEDLQAVTKDTHLYLSFEPAWFASAQQPAQAEDPQQIALEAQVARDTNHGLVEMKILPGNLRYLKVEGFDWVEGETPLAYDGAMRFLKGGRAIIIDLRGNGGGWVQASKYLISHFLDPDTLIATFHRADGEAEQYRAADSLPAGRIKGKPVYILIDGHSRSAAEMVAYTFQQYRLGELVGARTEGAANISDDFAVAPGFRLSVSTGRTVQPISKTDWEGVGVAPTVEADPAQALQIAELRAIDKLLPGSPAGMARYQLQWARPAVKAELHPVALSEAELQALAGTYGEASIRFQDHALWLHRPDRPAYRLAPMTRDGLFQAVGEATLRVRIAPDTLEVLRIDPAYSSRYRKAGR
jgi:hypothetical protein